MNNGWSELTYFQSFDLIRKEYHRWHNRELSSERTWEIISAFTQSQEYHASASSASEVVKPLLLYYSVLAASRAIVMFFKGTAEATLKPSHGLEPVDWNKILSGGSSLLNLTVRVTDGTYSALAEATSNSSIRIMDTHEGGLVLEALNPTLGYSNEKSIRLGDLLSREPMLIPLVVETSDQRSNSFRGNIFRSHLGTQIRITVAPGTGELTKEIIRDVFCLEESVEITSQSIDEYPLCYFSFFLAHEQSGLTSQACPIIERRDDKTSDILAAWPNGGYLSPLLRCFAESYFLGMLVRYYPSRWIGILRGRKGDAIYPLVQRLTDKIERDLPFLVRSQMRYFES